MHDRDLAFDPELERLAQQLASLAPQARLDRDQVMFAAGRRAGDRRLRTVNRLLAATSLALAAVAALSLGDDALRRARGTGRHAIGHSRRRPRGDD